MISMKKILTLLTEQMAQVFSFNKLATAIPSGSDLNSYTTPGLARSTSGTVSASLSNTPYTTGGFLLITVYSSGAGGRIQILFPVYLATTNGIFIRTYRNSNAWDSWLKISLTAV